MKVRRALGISAVSNLVSFLLSFTSVVVVSRLLTPAEIGVFSVAVSVLGFSHVFREFGVGQYLVQTKTLGSQELRAAFSVTLYCSWTIAIVLYLSRNALADFYAHQGIAAVLALLSFNFLIMPFGTPLMALMQRELEFGKLAKLRICNSVISTAVTIGSAWAGESYLSMAWGAIAGHLSNVILLNLMRSGQIFMLPTFKGLGAVIRFGSLSSLSSLLSELSTAMPDLILGRTLGFSDVAFYSRANGVRKMLLGQVLILVRGIHFPSFAKGLRDGKDPAELYSTVMVYVVAVTAPMMAVAALLAEPLILFLFGPQWEKAVPLAVLICIYAAVGTPYSMAPSSLVASGNINLLLSRQVAIEVTRASVFLSSIWVSLEAVVLAQALVACCSAMLYQNALKRAFNLSFTQLIKGLSTSFALVGFALIGPAIVMLLTSNTDLTTAGNLYTLGSSGLLAIAGWLTGIKLMKHPLLKEIDLARSELARRLGLLRKRR